MSGALVPFTSLIDIPLIHSWPLVDGHSTLHLKLIHLVCPRDIRPEWRTADGWGNPPEAVPLGSVEQVSQSIHMHLGPPIHGIRGPVFDPWWVVSLCRDGRMYVEASVLVGTPVDGWPMARSLLNSFGRPSGVGTLVPHPG